MHLGSSSGYLSDRGMMYIENTFPSLWHPHLSPVYGLSAHSCTPLLWHPSTSTSHHEYAEALGCVIFSTGFSHLLSLNLRVVQGCFHKVGRANAKKRARFFFVAECVGLVCLTSGILNSSVTERSAASGLHSNPLSRETVLLCLSSREVFGCTACMTAFDLLCLSFHLYVRQTECACNIGGYFCIITSPSAPKCRRVWGTTGYSNNPQHGEAATAAYHSAAVLRRSSKKLIAVACGNLLLAPDI